jgi:basic membrane lipoprotein Med (substrate-binding protein (PBP1-ABC) superfamily)
MIGVGIRRYELEAAKVQTGLLIVADETAFDDSDKILTSADLDYAGAVKKQIDMINNETFVGSQVINCGVREDGVKLIIEGRGFSDNTVQEYKQMCQSLSDGTLAVEETMVLPATTITTVVKE